MSQTGPQSSAASSPSILSNFSVKNMRALLHTSVSPSAIHWFGMSFVVYTKLILYMWI